MTEGVACTLGPKRKQDRIEEFRQVFAETFVGAERITGGVRWRFTANPGLVTKLESLAQQETSCCPFLHFRIYVQDDQIWWDTHGDADAQPVLDLWLNLPDRQLG